jgi:hypothetical protein
VPSGVWWLDCWSDLLVWHWISLSQNLTAMKKILAHLSLPRYSLIISNIILIHSFHCHVQNVTILCHSQELLPLLSVTYFFLPLFSTNYSSILPHFILPSVSWLPLNLVDSKIIYNTVLRIILSSTLCTCPNQHNLCNLTVSVTVGFLTIA